MNINFRINCLDDAPSFFSVPALTWIHIGFFLKLHQKYHTRCCITICNLKRSGRSRGKKKHCLQMTGRVPKEIYICINVVRKSRFYLPVNNAIPVVVKVVVVCLLLFMSILNVLCKPKMEKTCNNVACIKAML